LLVYNRTTNEITHTVVKDILTFLPPDSVFIFNDTKVVKARLFGKKATNGNVEVLFCKGKPAGLCEVLIRGRVRSGEEIFFTEYFKAVVQELCDDGARVVEFYYQDKKIIDTDMLYDLFDKFGHIPLPPYIGRDDNAQDAVTYQSNFAKHSGSVAAPTASLHFDDELLSNIKNNFQYAFVTLHVGLGTFKPVESAHITAHKIHTEEYIVSQEAKKYIDSNSKILSIGTTSARTVEHYHKTMTECGECNIFLHPANPPQRVNMLMTNFHLPKSTLIMLVASMVGLEKTLKLYKEAIDRDYRFYSYGDAMLIL
jgi:S-adenosylmethionine:tRNA ribosyltransferase-isomerase